MRPFAMSAPRKRCVLAVLVLTALTCGLAAYFLISRASDTVAHSPAESLQNQETYWQDRISAMGGEAAYAEFMSFVAGKDPLQEHELAHVFGDALYKGMGESGLTVCSGQASYGCFHAMVGHSIAEHGLSEVSSLVMRCYTSVSIDPMSCQHGIGHGIMGHFGYSKEDLGKALAVCKDMAVPDSIDSCYSGVFMEYSMRTMLGGGASVRPASDGLLAPCDSVEPQYLRACASQQPRWWMQVLGGQAPDAALYEKLGGLCNKLAEGTPALRTCFEALGEAAAVATGYVPDTAALLCGASSHSSRDQLFCLSYAASSITDGGSQEKGLQTCAALAGQGQSYCAAYATKKASIINPLPLPDTL